MRMEKWKRSWGRGGAEFEWGDITGQQWGSQKTVLGNAEAMADRDGKFVKTRWVLTGKGNAVWSRFVTQEFAKGDPWDDFLAGTLPLFAAGLLGSRRGSCPDQPLAMMALGASCAFLCAPVTLALYIELPQARAERGNWLRHVERAFYGTRASPQAWLDELSGTRRDMGFGASRTFRGV